jgi:sarcosine oxidase delta subunit
MIAKPSDIEIVHQYRVRCPQCGDHPDSPFATMSDAREARRQHFNDHRDERI